LYDLTSANNSFFTTPVKTSKTVKKSDTKHSVSQNSSNQTISNSSDPVDNTPLLSVIPDQPSSNTITYTPKNETKSTGLDRNENISLEKIENGVTKTSYSNDQTINSTEDLTNGDKESLNTPTSINKEITLPTDHTTSNLLTQTNAANLKSKRINNVTWTYYISPSLSYRNFSDEEINNAVLHKPRMGYEAGTAMSFNIYKKLQLTTGIQLNYSGYNVKANNTHPILATLVLNGETSAQYNTYYTMSTYGNNTGSELTTLKNYSMQASLPIGLQYVFAENDNIKFGAAAAFQPSIIIASKAYLLSTDKRNYLMASDLLRNWNMNTNFTTYVSFASSTFNWQIGPQVRYQLLSTYSNRYPVKEHLVNYGIRIGISKISK
jgi:hypothetical protein